MIAGLIGSVPPRDLKRRPQPASWSAHEHACHLAVLEPLWAARLQLILREGNPSIVSYEPSAEDPNRRLAMDLGRALAEFADARHALVTVLRGLRPGDWMRPATHSAHARYSLQLMCRHAALHDGLHAYRIEESALGSHWPTER